MQTPDKCYILPSDFDPFSGELNLDVLEEVHMIPVSEGIYTIRYDQDFPQTFTSNTKGYPGYYISIEDCNNDKYYISVEVDNYENFDVQLSTDSDYVVRQKDFYFNFELFLNRDNTYFYLDYIPKVIETQSYHPVMVVRVIEKESNDVVQEETIELTAFEYIEE